MWLPSVSEKKAEGYQAQTSVALWAMVTTETLVGTQEGRSHCQVHCSDCGF